MANAAGSHWLLEGEQARRRIDADAVVARAHDLVHEGGAGALTMRPLAASLGTSTSALYRLVPSKEWLLVAIVDLVFGEVDTSGPDSGKAAGRDRLHHLSRSVYVVLTAHPHLHEILTSHVAVTPNTLRVAEAALQLLREAGVDDESLVHAYNAWCGFVIGFTVLEAKPPDLTPEPRLQRAMRSVLDAATPEEHPMVTELMSDVATRAYGLTWRPDPLGGTRPSFEWGLTALLDGLAG